MRCHKPIGSLLGVCGLCLLTSCGPDQYGNPYYTAYRPPVAGGAAVTPAAGQGSGSVATGSGSASAGAGSGGAGSGGGGSGIGGTAVQTAELVCSSGAEWTQGNAATSRMRPGSDCSDCHSKLGGPIYGIQGTVYENYNEWDECFGVPQATVEVIGANGNTVVMNSNSAGNFYASRSKSNTLAMPFTARVHYNGQVIEKQNPQSSLNCAACHTEWGDGGASGRIVIP